jgi:hypothetical protein
MDKEFDTRRTVVGLPSQYETFAMRICRWRGL